MMVLLALAISTAIGLAAALALRVRKVADQRDAARRAVREMNDKCTAAVRVADQRQTALAKMRRRAERAELLLTTERDETRDLREKLENAEQMLAFEAARWEVGQ